MGDSLAVISRCEARSVGQAVSAAKRRFQVVCKETHANAGPSTVIILITINTAERKRVGEQELGRSPSRAARGVSTLNFPCGMTELARPLHKRSLMH